MFANVLDMSSDVMDCVPPSVATYASLHRDQLHAKVMTSSSNRTSPASGQKAKVHMINKGRSAPISAWLLASQFKTQQLNLSGARVVLRNTIGFAPKDKIFKKYIKIEQQLGNMDRCRKLYEKYLEWSPENCYAWSKYVTPSNLSTQQNVEYLRALLYGSIAQDLRTTTKRVI
ncbi:crooked neck-like protein 1 [Tanacetum coccineum]